MKTATEARRTATYWLYDADNALLYVGIGYHFGVRWEAHARQQAWWSDMDHQTVRWYPTRELAREAELTAIRTESPLYNVADVPRDPTTGFYVARKPQRTNQKRGYTSVSVTPGGRDALQRAAILGTTAIGKRVTLSQAARALAVHVRNHPDEFRDALADLDEQED